MEENRIMELNTGFGISIGFDNVVEKTISHWQIEPVTLLTRIGGIIGVGKELLWVLIIAGSSITIVVNSLKSKDRN